MPIYIIYLPFFRQEYSAQRKNKPVTDAEFGANFSAITYDFILEIPEQVGMHWSG